MLDFSAPEIEAVRLSLRVAFWAMVGSLPFGMATAIVLARGRFYGKSLLDGVVHLPLVMPPVVTGYLLLLLFGRHGPVGRFLEESFGIVFVLVTLPLLAPGIIAGMVLSFARSLGEFGATITFVSNIPGETRTIASAIYTLTQTPGGDVGALRLTLVSIALSFVALLAADLLARRLGRRLSGD